MFLSLFSVLVLFNLDVAVNTNWLPFSFWNSWYLFIYLFFHTFGSTKDMLTHFFSESIIFLCFTSSWVFSFCPFTFLSLPGISFLLWKFYHWGPISGTISLWISTTLCTSWTHTQSWLSCSISTFLFPLYEIVEA